MLIPPNICTPEASIRLGAERRPASTTGVCVQIGEFSGDFSKSASALVLHLRIGITWHNLLSGFQKITQAVAMHKRCPLDGRVGAIPNARCNGNLVWRDGVNVVRVSEAAVLFVRVQEVRVARVWLFGSD